MASGRNSLWNDWGLGVLPGLNHTCTHRRLHHAPGCSYVGIASAAHTLVWRGPGQAEGVVGAAAPGTLPPGRPAAKGGPAPAMPPPCVPMCGACVRHV